MQQLVMRGIILKVGGCFMMKLGPSKQMTVGSGNGNKPKVNVKLAFFQVDIHIHDIMSIFKVVLGVLALVIWLKSLDDENEPIED